MPTEPLPPPDDTSEPTDAIPTAEASGQGGWRRFGGRDMPVAIISAVLLAALLLGTLFWSPAAFTALVLVLVLVAVVETGRAFRRRALETATPVVLVASVVLLVGAYQAGAAGQAVGVAVRVLGAFVWEMVDSERREVVRVVAATVFLGLWLPFLGSYAVLLVRWQPDAWVAILAAVAVPVISDIGAFAIGTHYGRRRLAPSLSPKKTWEGLLGGLAVALVLAVAILPFLGTGELFSPLSAAVFAITVGIAGALGDLTESMVKRELGLKDIGGFIPGHGGILDRVDSILFALPTAYYVLVILHA
jgi:phosphatidate cytidylyltransferase